MIREMELLDGEVLLIINKTMIMSSLAFLFGLGFVLAIVFIMFGKNKVIPKKMFDADLYSKKEKILKDILANKFDFYFIAKFYPLFEAGKEIDKKLIGEIKEAFYSDIMMSTPQYIIKYFQKELTVKGLDILIIQYYFTHLNKADAKFNKNDNSNIDMDNSEMDKIIGLLKH